MQGQSFEAKVLALPLDNYHLVLGVQWLIELGDIVWNFKNLQIKFHIGDKEYVLQGEQVAGHSLSTVFGGKLSKVLRKTSQIAVIQCLSLRVKHFPSKVQVYNLEERVEEIPLALQKVLTRF